MWKTYGNREIYSFSRCSIKCDVSSVKWCVAVFEWPQHVLREST